jgi:hypothetical protein
MASGYTDPATLLTPSVPGATSPGILTNRQDRLLGRYQLRTMTGQARKASRASDRLAKMGINAAETAAGYEDPSSLAYDALHRMALSGAVGGKSAKMLKQRIGETQSLEEIGKWGDASKLWGQDQIAGQYGQAAQNLRAALGPDVDLSSPAVASLLAGMQEGRSTASQDFLNQLGIQQGQARQQVKEGFGAAIGNTLDETGSLVEALKQLKKQESDLANAQRGAFYGKMFGGPVGGLWGRQGALAGQQANPQMDLQSLIQMFMGGVPAGGAA